MTASEDGTLRGEEVESGTFVLNVGAFLVDSAGKPSTRLVAPAQPITIPDNPSSGTLDLGVITLQAEAPPR
jgi:hypothetical protein